MRDLIYGDTNSGINRIVQVFLTAFAIALGTAAAWHVTAGVYGQTVSAVSGSYPVWASPSSSISTAGAAGCASLQAL